jgi:chaperonin GroEL
MEAKDIRFGGEIHGKLVNGVDCLANAVKTTMGPKGRYVVLSRGYDIPLITKDGMAVARQIELKDRFENAGAQTVKEVALRMAETVGDGSTTATVLAQAMIHEGMKYVTVGMNPMDLKRGIDQAVAAAVEELGKLSLPCTSSMEISQVGAIAANGDRVIGEMMAEAFRLVGKDGVVMIEAGRTVEDELVMSKGMRFDSGFLSLEFATDAAHQLVHFENPRIALIGGEITGPSDILPLLELTSNADTPLLVVAENFADQVLTLLKMNSARGALKLCAVKAPGIGAQRRAILDDLAILTGGEVFSAATGIRLQEATLAQLGRAKRVEVSRESTTVIEGGGDRGLIAARVRHLHAQMKDVSPQERAGLKHRVAKLAGGVATVKVGADTEMAMNERKQRMEDALQAMRASMDEGIVPGGGVALLRTQAAIQRLKGNNPDINAGIDTMLRAVEAPLCQIAANAGAEPLVVLAKVRQGQGGFGFNAATSEYGDVLAMGVVDATKVVRSALQHAASVAGLMLTTECMVVGLPDA